MEMKFDSFRSFGNLHLFNACEKTLEVDLRKKAKADLIRICKPHNNSYDRVNAIMQELEPFFKHIDRAVLPEDHIAIIKHSLSECRYIKDKKEFFQKVFTILAPFIELRKTNPAAFEDAQARVMNEKGGLTEINRLLSYGKSDSIIHIHATHGKTVEEKLTLYRSGFRKLAELVRQDPEIQTITATSHLVASHESLFKRMGFTIENATQEFLKKYFRGEKRKVKHAYISREDFLKNFPEKN